MRRFAVLFLVVFGRVDMEFRGGLLTDVVMPGGMGGPELAQEGRARRPDLKVLFTSGYTENAIVHGGVLDEGVEMIGKPYQKDELAHKVRRVLDS